MLSTKGSKETTQAEKQDWNNSKANFQMVSIVSQTSPRKKNVHPNCEGLFFYSRELLSNQIFFRSIPYKECKKKKICKTIWRSCPVHVLEILERQTHEHMVKMTQGQSFHGTNQFKTVKKIIPCRPTRQEIWQGVQSLSTSFQIQISLLNCIFPT